MLAINSDMLHAISAEVKKRAMYDVCLIELGYDFEDNEVVVNIAREKKFRVTIDGMIIEDSKDFDDDNDDDEREE